MQWTPIKDLKHGNVFYPNPADLPCEFIRSGHGQCNGVDVIVVLAKHGKPNRYGCTDELELMYEPCAAVLVAK